MNRKYRQTKIKSSLHAEARLINIRCGNEGHLRMRCVLWVSSASRNMIFVQKDNDFRWFSHLTIHKINFGNSLQKTKERVRNFARKLSSH